MTWLENFHNNSSNTNIHVHQFSFLNLHYDRNKTHIHLLVSDSFACVLCEAGCLPGYVLASVINLFCFSEKKEKKENTNQAKKKDNQVCILDIPSFYVYYFICV